MEMKTRLAITNNFRSGFLSENCFFLALIITMFRTRKSCSISPQKIAVTKYSDRLLVSALQFLRNNFNDIPKLDATLADLYENSTVVRTQHPLIKFIFDMTLVQKKIIIIFVEMIEL